jgi:hypothetical protein
MDLAHGPKPTDRAVHLGRSLTHLARFWILWIGISVFYRRPAIFLFFIFFDPQNIVVMSFDR